MKRVGNKSGQLVRSASRRRKASSRFQFDVTVEKVYGVKPATTYSVKWSRGVKVAQTKSYPATKETSGKAGLAINEKLSLLVTLYREEGRKFDPKDAKISLISINTKKQEKTAAKLHFDLSQYAGVPSASTNKILKLSDKISARVTIESRFLKAGTGGPGSAGASSALSGVSARSSDDDLDDDFDDLALDDVPEADSITMNKKTSSVSKRSSNGPSSNVPLLAEVSRSLPAANKGVPLRAETPTFASSITSERKKSSPSASGTTAPATNARSPPPRAPRERPLPVTTADVKAFAQSEDKTRLEMLRKENERISADLSRQKTERSSLEDSHRRELETLHAQLEQRAAERKLVEAEKASNATSATEVRRRNAELEATSKTLETELDAVKRNRDELSKKCKILSTAEEKRKELSREVDRLTVLAARSGTSAGDPSATSEIEKRMETLGKEKETLDNRVRAHETHAAKVKQAYEKLSGMYNKIREEHTSLQKETEELRVNQSSAAASATVEDGKIEEELQLLLKEAQQEIRDVKANKDSLQSDYDRLLYQTDSLQDRLEIVSQQLDEVRREKNDLYADIEEVKGQRDMATQRALSKGKSTSSNGESTRSIGRVEEDLRLTKDKFEREQTRLTQRTTDLESEITDLREDIEYEKSEKLKAREERDKFRESARALERRTSLAARQNDAMHSMRRQLSTHQKKEQEHEAMVAGMRNDMEALQRDIKEARNEGRDDGSGGRDEVGEILQGLVATKLALAQAEDEKLRLQFDMKKMKKSEKAIQEKLAGHASRLEVKLGQANEELEKLRRQRAEDASEFNDLDSDVDY